MLQEIQFKKNKNRVGKFKKVLVENKMKNQSKFFGRTIELTPVVFDATELDVGKVVNIEITNCNKNTLFGFKTKSENEVAA